MNLSICQLIVKGGNGKVTELSWRSPQLDQIDIIMYQKIPINTGLFDGGGLKWVEHSLLLSKERQTWP